MALKKVDTDLDFSGIGRIVRALMNPVTTDPPVPGIGELWYNTVTDRLKVNTGAGIVSLATLSDVTGGAITGTLWNAQTVVTAVVNDNPSPQIIGESEVLGRLSGGNIGAVTFAQLLSALETLGITADTLGTKSEAQVLDRANHTGAQLSATISDFNTAVDTRVEADIAELIGAAPESLDTLFELAAALGDNPNFSADITAMIGTKAGRFAANVGNAVAQSFIVNHGLGTTDVVISVRVNATGALVEAEVAVTDANNVTIATNSVPALDAYRVVVVG